MPIVESSPVVLPDETPADSDLPQGPPTSSDPPSPTVKLTTAVGLSAQSSDAAGYTEAIARAADCADVGLVQVTFAWDFLRGHSEGVTYRAAYDWMIAPDATGQDILQRSGLGRAFWLSFTDPVQPEQIAAPGVSPPVTFADPQVQSVFAAECAWFANRFQPDYLALGVELDTYLAAANTEEREGFLAAFVAARDACKAARPTCRVFVYFQYENVQARDLWATIAPFAEASDVYAFSSYPSSPIQGPNSGWTSATLTDTYYHDIVNRLGADRPIVIAELGHPAAPSEHLATGSTAEQAAMISQVFRALEGLDVALVSWTYLHDPDLSSVYAPACAAYFGSMGLLRADQQATGGAGWAAWIRQ